MIKSFADKRTVAIFLGQAVRGMPVHIQQRVRSKLLAIDAARRLDDLRAPPGNRLESLRGDREGQYLRGDQHSRQQSVAHLFPMARWRYMGH